MERIFILIIVAVVAQNNGVVITPYIWTAIIVWLAVKSLVIVMGGVIKYFEDTRRDQ